MTKGIYFIFLSFAFIAAMMAYLISYNEWIHHYPTKKEPRKIALETAIFTFVVFGVIIFIVIQMLV
jgi:hypothetical protein